MGRFSNVLLASGFHHTLTDTSGQIPAPPISRPSPPFRPRAAFSPWPAAGSIPMFRKKAALVPVNAPCILYNGGACYDYRTDELLFAFPLADDAPQLLQALRNHCPNERTEVQTLDCHYAYGDDPRRDAALAANGVPVQHEAALPPQPWIKLAVYGTSKQVGYDDPANTPPEEIAYFDELQRYTAGLVGNRYAITRALPRNMEISAGGCDKGTAARRLADTLGRSILVCVGDAPNDLAMLQAADYGFRTGDCDPAMRRYDFRDAAPSVEGSVSLRRSTRCAPCCERHAGGLEPRAGRADAGAGGRRGRHALCLRHGVRPPARPRHPYAASFPQLYAAWQKSPLSRGKGAPVSGADDIDVSDCTQQTFRCFNDFLHPAAPAVRPDRDRPGRPARHRGLQADRPAHRRRHASLPSRASPTRLGRAAGGRRARRALPRAAWCLIFRLSPDDYHRYAYPDAGTQEAAGPHPRRAAQRQPHRRRRSPSTAAPAPARCCTPRASATSSQMEVGALPVGRICNHTETAAASLRAPAGEGLLCLRRLDRHPAAGAWEVRTRRGYRQMVGQRH